ncbi:MAG TPA: hypothetical protein DCL15_14075 [Chloroflexi bacterium]|nr:hypothetical protein [Chloroflexota bacterium]HHW88751.1 PAS domain S-box protein [Chloroflexota bacterium]
MPGKTEPTPTVDAAAMAAQLRNAAQDNPEAQHPSLALLWAHLPAAVITTDAELRIQSWNAFAETLYGWRADEVRGREIDEVCQSHLTDGARADVQRLLRERGVWRGEIEQRHRDGSLLYVDASVAALRNDQGDMVGSVALHVDITGRRQAFQALAASEANYQQAISAVGAIAYSLDYVTNRYTFMSPNAEELTGYPLATLTPDFLATLVIDSTPTGPFTGMTTDEVAALIRSGQGGNVWHCDYHIRTHDGKERWVYDASIQIMGEDGIPTGAVGILQDITVRKQMEAALRASEEQQRQLAATLEARVRERTSELQAQRDFVSQIMDALGQGLVVSDEQGRAVYVNPAMARLLDALPSTLIGARLTDYVVPEDLPMVNALFPARLQDEDFQFEVRLCTHSGQIKPVLISTTPQRQNGAIVGRIALFTDLTEIKTVEASLRQSRDDLRTANAALERALRLKDEFLASMSHELRTPLTGILGLAEALQLQVYGALNERQLRSVETIWESGQHLLRLINDILDLSKLAASQLDIVFEQCDVADICQGSLSLIKGMAHKKQLNVDLHIEQPDMSVRGDPRRLKQMLVNLLGNAVKFTPTGGSIGLRVRGDADRQVITFAVWDTGIGIAAADLERIFIPFTQLDSGLTREYAGVGLGLALVERMVRTHGGSISVESTPGVGSTFTLTLPWSPQTKPAAATSAPAALTTNLTRKPGAGV